MATAFFLSLKPPSFPSTTTRHHPIRPSSADPKAHNHRFPPQISFSSFRNNNGIPSETECPVPLDQQPINEYQALSNSFPFSWASGSLVEYCARLFVTGASFALLVGLPVSWFGSVGPKSEPLRLVFGAASSGFFVVTLAVVRMYLGWAYVGNRLLSATVEYEETGWYDGQIWVKTAEVLARDRLLGSFSVYSCCFPPNFAGHTCNYRYNAEYGYAITWNDAVQLTIHHFEHKPHNVFTCNCHLLVVNCLSRFCFDGSMS